MDKLSEVLSIGINVLIFIMLCIGIFQLVMHIIRYKKVSKQAQSYNEIVANTPALRKYLDQGYQLLTIMPAKETTDAYISKTEVFDYPDRADINPIPLFYVECNYSLKNNTPRTTEINTQNYVEVTSEYTEQLPLTASPGFTKTKGQFLPEYAFYVKKEGEPFLQMNTPNASPQGGTSVDDNAWPITSSHIPESQQWRWNHTLQCTSQYHYILREIISNRELIAIIPAVYPIRYLLVHPEMPKALVPIFVELSLQSCPRRKR
jgi:hypothetical protein